MAFEVTLTSDPAGLFTGPVQADGYTYSEESSPLSGADSSGSVGTFSVTLPIPDADIPGASRHPVWSQQRLRGDNILHGSTVNIFDSRKGLTTGVVKTVARSKDRGSVTLSGTTRMSLMNIFNIQAQPYSGTLGGAITYYLGLAGISTAYVVDPAIASQPVTIPGWFGELWLHMKQLVSAFAADISLVSNIIYVRPVRQRVASVGRDTTRSTEVGGYQLAQAVEVYQYNNRPITNELVYPIGRPSLEDRVLNVNAGEVAEYSLELSASLSSFLQPTMVSSMTPDYVDTSAYTITASEGTVILPQDWTNAGGLVEFTLDPTTTAILVKMTGPSGMLNADATALTSFSMSLPDPITDNRFSTLRIIGSGVAFDKQKKRVRTGVPASIAGTDVGVTIDNPNISTANDVARVGVSAARKFAGTAMTLSGEVISVNRRGDTGQVILPTYEQVQNVLVAAIGGTPTYAQVQAYYTSLGLTTYGQIEAYWKNYFADPDVDQVFGNVQGARVYDAGTHRWYRVRSANLTAGGISFSEAEDDLTYADYQEHHAGKTYAQVQAELAGLTYRQVELIGMV